MGHFIFAPQQIIMRKLLVLAMASFAFMPAFSQENSSPKKQLDLNKAGDHIMIQLGLNSLTGAPDSIKDHIGGFQRSANVYLMLNKPFKNNPKMSIGIGAGISTSNIYFKDMIVDIASTQLVLPFIDVDSAQNFKKFKLSTTFVEVPLELRFTAKPETPSKSLKAAIGIKAGLLLSGKTKGKTLRSASGSVINDYTEKVVAKKYFNSSRLSATARVGYGNFTLFGAYSFGSMFKDGVAADMKLFQAGITISGL